MITYRRRGLLKITQAWYWDGSLEAPQGDIIHYHALTNPAEGSEPFPTIWIDLSKPEERLLAEMNKTTRYEVRKAADYGLRYEFWYLDSAVKVDEFVKFYDSFLATAKHLPPADGFILRKYAAVGVLDLSRVSDRDGTPLVWHVHFRDSEHAHLMHSASVFRIRQDSEYRTLLGRANRWGHWEDMKRFKRAGIRIYDFGGRYPGENDEELLRVNAFKEGFGGQIVKTYVCTRAVTPLGRMYLWVGRLRERCGRFYRNPGQSRQSESAC